MTTTILKGHVSPETAYVVDDYPFGFRLRCKIRYWLEFRPLYGFRFMSQTTNPKKGDVWNKPKASTYSRFGACMLLNVDNGHVEWRGLSEFSTYIEARIFLDTYGDGIPDGLRHVTQDWVDAKSAYEAKKYAQREAAQ